MIFHPTPIAGVRVIDLHTHGDERGFFARLYSADAFAADGAPWVPVQVNNSLTAQAGTLRGLHYQLPPSAEIKLLRCISGALWDVALDLRPDSPTFRQWFGTELTAQNRRMMLIPTGCAHGFITLSPDTETIYLVSAAYDPPQERGARWNDPAFAIDWPIAPSIMSAKDAAWPDLDSAYHGLELLHDLI